ncbi:hypothetical protein HU200_019682 [Digitaria exilis]|uniref:Ty3 transposon capsid-like protein domain-containing protein n=1 Tax=Digitaria exilis TaxID=1010633 RepID=A0A835F260_9POAL|nr:hypothetical protein HU200_019682 [Digitaria exilis]
MVNTRTGGGRDVPSQRRDHVVNQQNQAPPPPPPQPAMDPAMQQFLATQMQLIQQLTQTVANLQAQQNQQPPPPPEPVQPPRDHHRQFLSQHPPTYSHSADPLDADDWLKNVAKKLNIAQCTDREKVLYASGRLEGPAADWWDAYVNAHNAPDTITWQQFQDAFRTHHIPAGVQKRKFQSSSSGQTSNTRPRYNSSQGYQNRSGGNGGHYQQGQQAQRSGQQAQRYSQQTPRTPNQQQNRSGNGTPPVRTNNPVTPTPQAQRSDGQRSVQSSSQQGNQGQQNYARGRVNHVTAEAAQEASDVVIVFPGLFPRARDRGPALFFGPRLSLSSLFVSLTCGATVSVSSSPSLRPPHDSEPFPLAQALVSPGLISRRPDPLFRVAIAARRAQTLGLTRRRDSSCSVPPSRSVFASEFLSPLSRALLCSCDFAAMAEPLLAAVSLLHHSPRPQLPPKPNPASFRALAAAVAQLRPPRAAVVLPLCPEPLDLNPTATTRFKRTENDPFEGDQDQVFEEEPPQPGLNGSGERLTGDSIRRGRMGDQPWPQFESPGSWQALGMDTLVDNVVCLSKWGGERETKIE